MEFPKGKKYSIIYSDPPWAYRDRRDKHPRLCGGASAHYKTMKTDEIMQLPVEEIAADDAFLFIWATFPNGDLPRIELFARQRVSGWDCWGLGV